MNKLLLAGTILAISAAPFECSAEEASAKLPYSQVPAAKCSECPDLFAGLPEDELLIPVLNDFTTEEITVRPNVRPLTRLYVPTTAGTGSLQELAKGRKARFYLPVKNGQVGNPVLLQGNTIPKQLLAACQVQLMSTQWEGLDRVSGIIVVFHWPGRI